MSAGITGVIVTAQKGRYWRQRADEKLGDPANCIQAFSGQKQDRDCT